ncbi:WxL domain-containing protein [Levilactobacillus bambusae]|uniref:WxL domain-containing protein n=1 Tax=Levilactobacillus bambusae TaxID=2024736 RepID=A0A2V1MZS7_9LACO|nr:WxL domain-containing protein [Levilactobacillus bambusae]PWG00273.1 hypothetical protein DCM90_04905 [Levilactobacillus bambusae]
MKKGIVPTLLVSAIMLGGVGVTTLGATNHSTANAAESSDSASGSADISFTANTSSTTPSGPSDSGDSSNNGTGDAGPLSLDYVPNLHFGTHPVEGTNTYNVTNNNPYVQVTDNTGLKKGWNVTMAYTEFANGANKLAGTKMDFAGSKATLTNPSNPSNSSNAGAPTVSDASVDPATPTNMATAQAGNGVGTWDMVYAGPSDDNPNIKLTVNGDETVGSYTSTMTWNLTAGPTA